MALSEAYLDSTSKVMKNQVADRITLQESFVDVASLESLVKGYILNCRCEGKSKVTVDTYEQILRRFLRFSRANGYPDEPQKTTPIHIRGFLWYLASESNRWGSDNAASRKPACQSTVNHYYRVLNTFFGWLAKEGFITNNPVAHLKKPKVEHKVVQALSPAEIVRLLDACSGKSVLDVRNKAILCVLLDTGLRVSELANLKLEDVDTKTGAILVRHGKGSKQRIVRIGSKAQKALWRYVTIYRRSDTDALFLKRSGEPLDAVGFKILIRRLSNKASVKIYAHKLRHTFAISYLRNGGDVFILQHLLGHATLQMTQYYLQRPTGYESRKGYGII